MFLFPIIKITARRINQSKVTSFFFVFGLACSMLLVSIAISFSFEHIYAGKNKSNHTPPNGKLYTMCSENGKQLHVDYIKKLLNGIRKGTGVIFNNLMAHPDQAEINTYCPVSAEWFASNDGWHYPLISGRYYTAEEIKEGKKVALIGALRMGDIRKSDGRQYIDFNGVSYEVLGVVGIESQRSTWDNRIFVPCTSLPGSVMEDLTLSSASFILYNELGAMEKDQRVIQENGETLASEFEVRDEGELQTEDMTAALMESQDPIYVLALLGYFVTLIYAINIVVFWIEKRRFEIGLRKAFGYADRDIAKLVFGEMFGLTFFSGMIAVVMQMIIGELVGRISGYTLKLYLANIIIGFAFALLTAFLTSIWPVMHALKIPPADVLKEGEKA